MKNRHIYVTGGKMTKSGQLATFTMSFAFKTYHWFSRKPEMNVARAYHSSTALGESLYVFGGFGLNGSLFSIEILD